MLETNTCETRYPVVLVHGTSAWDMKHALFWGRIPRALRAHGAKVYFGGQDGWGSVETNAEALVRRIDAICAETGCGKVNLIAHSKGGLDARMAASSLGAGDRIASVSTIGTPHHGSKTLDRVLRAPRQLFDAAAPIVNSWARLTGDRRPDFLRVSRLFSTKSMAEFNRANPDCPGIYYQSFGFAMRHPFSDVMLCVSNLVIGRIEGENDGLVSVESAAWGENHQVLRLDGFWGVSHLDEIDLRRNRLTGCGGKGYFDICDFYVRVVEDLRRRGL